MSSFGTQTAVIRAGTTAVFPRQTAFPSGQDAKWDFAFYGVLGYVVMEYSRLAEMFPILQPLQLGKITVLLAALGIMQSAGRSGPNPRSVHAVDACLIFFLLASVVSAAFADYSAPAWPQVINTLQWCVIYYIISRAVDSLSRLRVMMFVLLLLNLKLAQFVIRTYFSAGAMKFGSEYLAAHGVGAGSTGFFGNAGDLGVAMCVVWPLAGAMYSTEREGWRKWVYAVCFLAFLGAIVASSSRGAMLGAGMIALVSFLRNPKRMRGILMVLATVAAFSLVANSASRARMQSALDPEHDATARDRLDKWNAGMQMLGEHPVLGVGPGNYSTEYLMEHSPWERRKLMAVAPHSIFVQGLSELGIAGFIPLLTLWVLLIRLNAATRKILRSAGPEKCQGFAWQLAYGLDLALIGYLVSGAFLSVLYYPHCWILLGLSAALHRATVKEAAAQRDSKPELRKSAAFQRKLAVRPAC